MKDFRTLIVWQKGHSLTLSVYSVIKDFPKEELYGVSSQLRRATSSIPTNLAEGCGRGSDKDFKRFVQISMGSTSESEYLLLLCKDLRYLAEKKFNKLVAEVQEVKKMLCTSKKNYDT
jgi:four helix bundle protein